MTHHGAALRKLTRDPDLVLTLSQDWRKAKLSDIDRSLCSFAEKLTRDPASVKKSDTEELRSYGLDDRSILDATLIISMYNFVTRIACALGVELESYWQEGKKL